MQEIQYIGEVTWPSSLGHLLAIVAFVAALAGGYSYLRASSIDGKNSWQTLGKWFFGTHVLSVFGIIGLIFALMISRRYEFAYVWEHVSDDLPMQYLLSAFWEGQEGSFLLWMFWHCVLGIALILFAGKWQSRTMWVLMFVEGFIASMLLGIYFTDGFKVGVDPFALLRETMQAPIFSRPDYLTLIEGNGLNPLLQNYWMIIHPPTLFLGFASVTVPFCFAVGALHQRLYTEWLKPALPWALFSAAILGTGILMGGAWAYEALSFGGYWAWDPVENMSLVPWIILVAGMHANVVARSTGHSLRLAFAMYILSFVLVLYSTFLTRSGVLGDSSAHAFTQMGLEWQLVAFIAAFAGLGFYFLIKRWKSIPQPEKEEQLVSREFWMFVGTLVLLFSAILITFTTSIPVYNKILDFTGNIFNTSFEDLKRSMPVDPEAHYNKFQLWIAVVIALLSGMAQFMRYRAAGWSEHAKTFWKEMAGSALLAALLTVLISQWIDVRAWQYWALLVSASFGIAANAFYLSGILRRTPKMAGSALAHLGFSVMIIGILASGLNKSVLSSNPFAQQGLIDGMDPTRYITLIKNRPMYMNGYWVEYEQDTIKGNMREFQISYARVDENQDTTEKFYITPNVLFNNAMSKVEATNPSTKHYPAKDIFTYVAALPGEQMDLEEARRINDTLNFVTYMMHIGDTLKTEGFEFCLTGAMSSPVHEDYKAQSGDLSVGIQFTVRDLRREKDHRDSAIIYLREGLVYGFPAQVNDLNMRVRLNDQVIGAFYTPDQALDFQEFSLKTGEETTLDSTSIRLLAIDREASHPQYVSAEGDIAVNAVVEVKRGDQAQILRPLFFIRDSRPLNIKAVSDELGVHLRFEHIDPQTETFTFQFARDEAKRDIIPVEIATNVPRNDLIVIEAIVFPGINLFWIGAIFMMTGAAIAMWVRRTKRKAA